MTVSLRLSNEDAVLIKKYAELNKISVSDLIRQTVMERIETEYDLEVFYKALEEYRSNPVTYSLDDVERELGLK
ncbi:MAG: CopG family transcriptional regulator [Clostridia bacterium]|nr:CopG family transcriptional regulator [Clostridia bacterium]